MHRKEKKLKTVFGTFFGEISRVFLQHRKRIVIYYVKKFVKESQQWKQTHKRIGIFIHILSWRLQKHQCLFSLLIFFDEIFDAIIGDH